MKKYKHQAEMEQKPNSHIRLTYITYSYALNECFIGGRDCCDSVYAAILSLRVHAPRILQFCNFFYIFVQSMIIYTK